MNTEKAGVSKSAQAWAGLGLHCWVGCCCCCCCGCGCRAAPRRCCGARALDWLNSVHADRAAEDERAARGREGGRSTEGAVSRERSLRVQPGLAQSNRTCGALARSSCRACELPRAVGGRLKHGPRGEAGGVSSSGEPHMGMKNSSRMGSTETMALVLYSGGGGGGGLSPAAQQGRQGQHGGGAPRLLTTPPAGRRRRRQRQLGAQTRQGTRTIRQHATKGMQHG